MNGIQKQTSSAWLAINSTPIGSLPFTRRLRRKKHDELPESSSFITRPNTAVGLIWQRSNSAFWRSNVLIVASLTLKPSNEKPTPTKNSGMLTKQRLTGASLLLMRARNFSGSTHQFQPDKALAATWPNPAPIGSHQRAVFPNLLNHFSSRHRNLCLRRCVISVATPKGDRRRTS